jgi:hypothetical protein
MIMLLVAQGISNHGSTLLTILRIGLANRRLKRNHVRRSWVQENEKIKE